MKRIIFIVTALMSVLVLASCSKDDVEGGKVETPEIIAPDNNLQAISLSDAERLLSGELNGKFAFELFEKSYVANMKEPSVVLSPLSANIALAMLTNGADGQTLNELKTALGVDASVEEMNALFLKLTKDLANLDNQVELHSANSIWMASDFNVLDSYKSALVNSYNSDIYNFVQGQDGVDAVNKWCADNTNQKITKIIDESSSNAKFLLLNALYFKGKWTMPFNSKNTQKDEFVNMDGSKAVVEFMKAYLPITKYESNELYERLGLDFGNGAFTIHFVLPSEKTTLQNVVSGLSSISLFGDDGKQKKDMLVKLPKFKVNQDLILDETLKAMGVKDAFSGEANFKNLTLDDVMVGKVKQSNFFMINEEGAEGAGTTLVEIMDVLTPGAESQTPSFCVDRPFVYILTENSTGSIIFIGAVNTI